MLTGPAAVEMCRGSWFKQVPPSLIISYDDLNAGTLGSLQRRTLPPFPVSLLRRDSIYIHCFTTELTIFTASLLEEILTLQSQ
jgi:hypothetical protein